MYYIFFLILVFLSFFLTEKPTKTVVLCLIFFFIIIAGLRSPFIDSDYQNYLTSISRGWGIAEISFYWISDFSYLLTGDTLLVFIIYAIIGITTQFYAIYKYSTDFWLSFIFFFCTYFVLLDMNAMRAGAACGIAMLAWKPWSENKHLITLSLLILATLFHYSFGVLLLAYLFVKNNNKFIHYFVALVPLAYMFHFIVNLESLFALFNLTFVNVKFTSYEVAQSGELSIFSTVLILRIIVIATLYFFRDALSKKCDMFYLLLKLYILGFFIAVIISAIPIVAMRMLDIFVCSELILLPLFCEIVKPRYLVVTGIVLYAAFYFHLYIIAAEYIKPYELNL